MSTNIALTVPQQLKHPLFFSEIEFVIDTESYKNWNDKQDILFPYELLHWNAVEGFHPWDIPLTSLDSIFQQWERIGGECRGLFTSRTSQAALNLMIKGLSLLFCGIFWFHHKPVNLSCWSNELKDMVIKPINAEERIDFIISRPASYPSYIQLDQLFKEFKKIYFKELAIRMAKWNK
jgi:hypothetical protein